MWGYIFIPILLGAIIGGCIYFIEKEKYTEFVCRNSSLLLEQSKVNKSTNFFNDIKPRYFFEDRCATKRKLECLDMSALFMNIIERNTAFFDNLIKRVSANREEYNIYLSKIKALKSTATESYCKTIKTKLKKFKKYESRIFHKNIIHPTISTFVELKATYTSPKGRNSYYKKEVYDYNSINEKVNRAKRMICERQTRQNQIKIEREKVTPSLRYDVMRRDNFRCQICGSTASDGVKLHVDHIVPVSKGGKTTESNLRTLCDRCNMGKGAKTE